VKVVAGVMPFSQLVDPFTVTKKYADVETGKPPELNDESGVALLPPASPLEMVGVLPEADSGTKTVSVVVTGWEKAAPQLVEFLSKIDKHSL